jgi:hypothetical protein
MSNPDFLQIPDTRPKWMDGSDQPSGFAKRQTKNSYLCNLRCPDLRCWMIMRHASFPRSMAVVLSQFRGSTGLGPLVSRLPICRWFLISATCPDRWTTLIVSGFSLWISPTSCPRDSRYPDPRNTDR